MNHREKYMARQRKQLDTASTRGRAGAPQSEAKKRALSFKRSSVSKVIDRDAIVDYLLGLLDDIQDGITRLNDMAVSIPSQAPPETEWHDLEECSEEELVDEDP